VSKKIGSLTLRLPRGIHTSG